MFVGLDAATLLTGGVIFLARVMDVSVGTMRTISTVQGQTKTAFVLGLFEISIWLVVISTVISKITEQPALGAFYALGYSTGNVVGIKLEKWLAFGHTVLNVFSTSGRRMAEELRRAGFPVTTFQGEGKTGPVTELYVACRRRDLKAILAIVTSIDPQAFYITEQAGTVSKICRPFMPRPTGWRAVLKMK